MATATEFHFYWRVTSPDLAIQNIKLTFDESILIYYDSDLIAYDYDEPISGYDLESFTINQGGFYSESSLEYGRAKFVYSTPKNITFIEADFSLPNEDFGCYIPETGIAVNVDTGYIALADGFVIPLSNQDAPYENTEAPTDLTATRQSSTSNSIDLTWDGSLIPGDEWVILLSYSNGYAYDEVARTSSNSHTITSSIWNTETVRIYPSSNDTLYGSVTVSNSIPTLTAPVVKSAKLFNTSYLEIIYTPVSWLSLSPPDFHHLFTLTYEDTTTDTISDVGHTVLGNGDWKLRVNTGFDYINGVITCAGHVTYSATDHSGSNSTPIDLALTTFVVHQQLYTSKPNANLVQNIYESGLVMLFYGNGIHGDTVESDDIGNAVTQNVGTPTPVQYSTDEVLWEHGSLEFGNNRLSMDDSIHKFAYGNHDFTIDLKYRFLIKPYVFSQYIYYQYNKTNSEQNHFAILFYEDRIQAIYKENNVIIFNLISSVVTHDNTNRHGIAFERYGNTLTLYYDNTVVATTTFTGTIADTSILNALELGCWVYASGSTISYGPFFQGYVGDYRVVIGHARYKGTYNIESDYNAGTLYNITRQYYYSMSTALLRTAIAYGYGILIVNRIPYNSSITVRTLHRSYYSNKDNVLLRHVIRYSGIVFLRHSIRYTGTHKTLVVHRDYYESQPQITVMMVNRILYQSSDSIRLRTTQSYYGTHRVFLRFVHFYKSINEADQPIFVRIRQPYDGIAPSTTVTAQTARLLVHGSQPIAIKSASVAADEGSSYWQTQIELANPRDYLLLSLDTQFTLELFSLSFSFMIDSRELNRGMDDNGNLIETASISGLSPICRYSSRRSQSITKTFDTPMMASAIARELVEDIEWNMVDWLIPAYRFAVDHAERIEAAKTIVEAAGGYLESNPNGSVVARPQWPVSVPRMASVTPQHTLTNTSIFSIIEAPLNIIQLNRVRIMDAERTEQDQLEWIQDQDDWSKGILRAYPSPFRDGLYLRHTRGPVIHLSEQNVATEELTEVIEFIKGQASVAHPIEALINVTWMLENLGGLTFSQYSTQLTATQSGSYDGYSLASITYRTRFITAPARSDIETEAQFLLEDTNNGY